LCNVDHHIAFVTMDDAVSLHCYAGDSMCHVLSYGSHQRMSPPGTVYSTRYRYQYLVPGTRYGGRSCI
jgi:hypothetical protein